MGLLSGLLLFPITGPVYGLKFVLEQIQAQVDAQMLDEGQVIASLMTIGQQHDAGEISDEEYAAQEAALLEQVNAIRAYRASLIDAQMASDADGEDQLVYDDVDASDSADGGAS